MGVRIGTLDDLELCVKLAMAFGKTTVHADYIEEETVRELCKQFLTGNKAETIGFLYDDIGAIGGISTKFLYGSAKFAYEVMWWVEPEHRGTGAGIELLQAFEYWAKSTGCKKIIMVSIDDQTSKFYETVGYVANEHGYVKDL